MEGLLETLLAQTLYSSAEIFVSFLSSPTTQLNETTSKNLMTFGDCLFAQNFYYRALSVYLRAEALLDRSFSDLFLHCLFQIAQVFFPFITFTF
jgi:hypothetical protein